MSFVWDEQLGLFRREGYQPLPYSDGAEVEQRLYEVVRRARDRSSLSLELAAAICDWPSEYHLSRSRHCLLRPLGVQAGDRVLEVGCGCGALTRYLGEIGADVVAVEGSLLRARIAAERCRGFPNVKVFTEDLLKFQIEQKFDWVLLVGVLEYAPAFSSAPDPILHYLESVGRYLSPAGKLVVAIENKLGLKYFNGCSEDHIGIPFWGIQDLYEPQTPRTFGRRELMAHLSAAGLPHTSFYYPFPDYKVPTVILSAAALTDPDFDPVDLLVRSHARDYAGWPYRSFDEALVIPTLHNNGLLADLSNSFLVVATAEPQRYKDESELALAFATYRAPEFATQTRFLRCGSAIQVLKEPLTPRTAPQIVVADGVELINEFSSSTYRPGRQLLWGLLEARARRGDMDSVVQALHPWMAFLLRHALASEVQNRDVPGQWPRLASYTIPSDLFDCIPFNLLKVGSELVPIDAEWHNDGTVPLGWVVARGTLWSLSCGVPAEDHLQSATAVVEALCERVGLLVEASEIEAWLQKEAIFQRKVLGRPSEGIETQRTSSGVRSVVREVKRLSHSLAAKDEQLQALTRLCEEKEENVGSLRQALAYVNESIAGLDQTIAELTSAQSRAYAKRGEMQVQIRSLQGKLAENTERLSAVLSSSSWRWTSPLRAVRRIIRMLAPQLHRDLRADRRVVANSGWFDSDWYLRQYSDVAKAGGDPVLHYLEHGGFEGRDPSQRFSSAWYLRQHADVRAVGINPLLHYLRFGMSEGRQPLPTQESSPDKGGLSCDGPKGQS